MSPLTSFFSRLRQRMHASQRNSPEARSEIGADKFRFLEPTELGCEEVVFLHVHVRTGLWPGRMPRSKNLCPIPVREETRVTFKGKLGQRAARRRLKIWTNCRAVFELTCSSPDFATQSARFVVMLIVHPRGCAWQTERREGEWIRQPTPQKKSAGFIAVAHVSANVEKFLARNRPKCPTE